MNKMFAICLLVGLCLSCAPTQEEILVIEGGRVEGIPTETEGVVLYKGIPYAASPVGELRWKAPQPVKPWQGVLKCDKWGPASLQGGSGEGSFYWREFYQGGAPQMSEDCLYLNVWKPAEAKMGDKLPVMVWIHGGAYQNGYGHEVEFDGSEYARRGVILVTLNYRLGVCGFLAHPLLSEESGQGSGNFGLLDQLAALKWVQRNIEAFGGDAGCVTLFGQSAGAGSVQSLVSSPLAKGLIHRAIIQSGGGLGGIITAKSLADAEAMGQGMVDEAGCTTLQEMRTLPAERFQEALMAYYRKQKAPFIGLPWGPVIDGYLLTDTLNNVAYRGEALDIPYLIGYCSEDIAPETMRQSAVGWSLLQERLGRRPAYVYQFCRDLPGEDMPSPQGGFGDMKGAFHSAELWYVFGTLGRCWRPMTPGDYALSHRMVDYWTQFARTGDPNGEGLPRWNPCTKADPHVQALDVEDEAKQPLYESGELSVTQLNPETWQIENGTASTMYLLKGSKRALLIDTGMTVDSLDAVVRRFTTLPLDVAVSHNHVDHVGGNRFFSEVWMHPADKDVRQVPYEGRVQRLCDGQRFDLGGRVIQVMHTPGHTPGSVVFLDEKYRSAFTGDAFGSGHVWLQLQPHIPMSVYQASCTKMLVQMRALGISKLYPGHFAPYGEPFDRTYMDDMIELASKLSRGDEVESKEYPFSKHIDIAAPNTRCVVKGRATLVYDADHIN